MSDSIPAHPVHRHRALRGDDLIGHVVATTTGWAYTSTWSARSAEAHSASPARTYTSAQEAEDALRDDADRRIGERIVAGAFVAALAAHPALLLVDRLL